MRLKTFTQTLVAVIAVTVPALANADSGSAPQFTVNEMYKLITKQRREALIAEHNEHVAKLNASKAKAEAEIENAGGVVPSSSTMTSDHYSSAIDQDVLGGEYAKPGSSTVPMKLIEIAGTTALITFGGELKQVSENDLVNGYKVIKIAGDSVKMMLDGEISVLKIDW